MADRAPKGQSVIISAFPGIDWQTKAETDHPQNLTCLGHPMAMQPCRAFYHKTQTSGRTSMRHPSSPYNNAWL